MKNRIISIIITIVMVLSFLPAIPAYAQYSGICGENVIWTFDELTGILTISGEGDMTDYRTYTPYITPWNSYMVTEVIIKEGVTSVGECAFYDMSDIVSITIPESVTHIAKYAFAQTGITEVSIPDSVSYIGDFAFCQCRTLSSVSFGDKLTSIGLSAFAICPIAEIDLPSSLINIGESAFSGCLLTHVTVPNGVKYIGNGAFTSEKLKSIDLPKGLEFIGNIVSGELYSDDSKWSDGALYIDNYLLSVKKIDSSNKNYIVKEGTKLIAQRAFQGASIESVYIPSSVDYICTSAFERASVKSVTIAGDLKQLGKYAFGHCFYLKEVKIYGNVDYIGAGAFENCSALESIGFYGNVKIFDASVFSSCSSLKSIELPEGLKVLGSGAFSHCSSLVSIVIPDSVTYIEDSLFSMCTNLESVTIPDSVKKIGVQAFFGCSSLKNLVMGENVEEIKSYAFYSSGITNIQMGDKPVKIESDILYNTPLYNDETKWENGQLYLGKILIEINANTPEVVIKEGTTSVASRATYNSGFNVKSLVIPDSVKVIGQYAFSNFYRLENISISKNLEFIGVGAVPQSCLEAETDINGNVAMYFGKYLISVDKTSKGTFEVKKGTTLIAGGAFLSCHQITEIVLPESVQYISERAFYEMHKLEKIKIPDGVSAIEDSTFHNCPLLENIDIPKSVEKIADYAFSRCSSLREIVIPESVVEIGKNVFDNCVSLKQVDILANTDKLEYMFINCNDTIELTITKNILYLKDLFSYQDGDRYKVINFIGTAEEMDAVIFDDYETNGYLHTAIWRIASAAEPESVSIEGDKEVKKGGSVRFKATVLPADAKDKSVKWSSSNENVAKVDSGGNVTGVSSGYAVITAETVNGLIAARLVEVVDTACKVMVKGYDLDDMTGSITDYEYEILPYATVTIGNITKTADEYGEVIFEQAELPQEPYADVKIYYNDEYETKESTLYFIDSGEDIEVYTFLLRELDDNISFRSINAFIKNRKHNLLKQVGKTYISYFDDKGNVNEEAVTIDVIVEWGKHKENTSDRKIWLEGTVEGKTVPMIEGANIVKLTDYFDIEEPIKLVATTKNKEGNEVRCEKILPVELRIVNVKLEVPDTENVSSEDLYLLENLSTKISLGDISKVAGEIAYEKGTIILEFGGKDGENKNVSLFDGFLVGKAGPEVSVTGRVQIPVNKAANGKWSGGVKVNMGRKASAGTLGKKETVELFGTTYNFTVSGLPCYIDSNLEAGVEGALELSGDYEKALFTGKLESKGSFDVSGGLGAGYEGAKDDIELKVGVEGKLDVKLPATYTYTGDEQKVEFDPEIKGSVNGKIEAKILVIDVEGRLEFGSVTWTKNGAVWKVFGEELNEANLMELTEEDWQIVGRSYLENGGGFMAQSELFEEQEKDFTVLYENVIPVSDMSMTLVDNVPYIFFVSDLQSRDDANNAALMYTSYVEGEWSYPEAVYDDATVDTDVDADGNFIVWENSEREITMNDTLEDILKATNISVAVMDGDAFCVKELGEDGIYDFGAKVKMCDRIAYVAWLSNNEGDFTAKKGTTNINYSIYDGEWSEVCVIEDVGEVTNLNVLDGKIIYKKGTEIYSFSMSEDTEELLATDAGRYAIEEAQGKVILSYLDNEKMLRILENGVETANIETAFSGSENPTLAMSEGKAYVFWREADGIYFTTNASGEWSEKLLLANVEGYVSNITVVATDEGYHISYYVTVNGVTSLVTYTCEDGFDYAVTGAEYDYDMYTSEGKVCYKAEIKNNGELTGKDVEIHILEDGDLVYKALVDEVILPGEVYIFEDTYSPGDWRVGHEYEIEVVCPLDRNVGNNSILLSVGEVDVAVEDAYLEKDDFGNIHLYARVTNNGNIIAENFTVKVYEDDLEEELERRELTLGEGDTRLVEFALSPQRDAVYNISIDAEDDVNMYNNTMLIYYDAIETAGINIPFTDSTSGKVVLIIAVYSSEGVLKSVKRETIEMSQMGSMTLERVVGDIEAGDKVKVMAWDGVNMLVPVTSATMTN